MLHELLVAMTGCTGDIFVPYPPPPLTPTTFAVRPDYPFLHPSERNSLNRLSQLGFWYSAIAEFIHIEKLKARATYMLAFVLGVERVTDEYCTLIMDTESSILKREEDELGRTPISMLMSVFSEHHSILRWIYDTILLVQRDDKLYYGCRLLNLVYKRTQSGDTCVSKAFTCILHACNTVLFRQLSTWLLYGQLQDRYNEFFITQQASLADKQPGSTASLATGISRDAQQIWSLNLQVDKSMLPYIISLAMAETVLFVGKASATVRAARNRDQLILPDVVESHLRSLTSLLASPRLLNMEFEVVLEQIRKDYAGALWRVVVMDEKMLGYTTSFRAYFLLGQGDFFQRLLGEFESFKIKAVNRIAEPSLHELNSLFRQASTNTSNTDDPLFHKYHLLLIDNKKDTVPSTLPPQLLYPAPFGDKWFGAHIKLSFDISWPLDLIFTKIDLDKYNAVFGFLMTIRRIQLRVTRLHLPLAHDRNRLASLKADTAGMANLRDVWNVRGFMVFYLNTLWSHFQMDIIESRFCKLQEDIMDLSSRDYSVLETLHSNFINAIVKWTYLDTTVSSLLRDIVAGLMDRVERFCSIVELTYAKHVLRAWDAIQERIGFATDTRDLERKGGGTNMIDTTRASYNDLYLSDEEHARFEIVRIGEAFRKDAKFFYAALQGAKQSGVEPVDQLLTRLDYNRYFSLEGDMASSAAQRIMDDDIDRIEEEDRWERIQVDEVLDNSEGWEGQLSRGERSFR